MITRRHLHRLLLLSSSLALAPLSRGQTEGALVTRHGAQVHGVIEGSLVALDEAADVSIDRTASIYGDVVLPTGKPIPSAAAPDPANTKTKDSKVSPNTKIAVADSNAIKGKQKAVAGFKVPKVESPHQPRGKDAVILQNDKDKDPDFKKLKDLTVKSSKREVFLPAGSYGDIVVESGHLQLGQKGAPAKDRYYFQSLSVGANGSLDLLGAVVVIVGHLGAIQGKLGNELYTNWLDLRVVSGAVVLGSDTEIHGVMTAPESAVTMGQRVKVRGGVVCDQASVDATARFTGVQPSWGKESSGNSLPLFIHKAARVESRIPEMAEHYAGRYTVSTGYPNDEPVVLLLQASGRNPSPSDQIQERHAFFEACCTLFDGTGFARGEVLIQRPLPAGSRTGSPVVSVSMERGQFEDHLWAIGRQLQVRDNIVRIRDDPALLKRFMDRSLTVARQSAGVR